MPWKHIQEALIMGRLPKRRACDTSDQLTQFGGSLEGGVQVCFYVGLKDTEMLMVNILNICPLQLGTVHINHNFMESESRLQRLFCIYKLCAQSLSFLNWKADMRKILHKMAAVRMKAV